MADTRMNVPASEYAARAEDALERSDDVRAWVNALLAVASAVEDVHLTIHHHMSIPTEEDQQ